MFAPGFFAKTYFVGTYFPPIAVSEAEKAFVVRLTPKQPVTIPEVDPLEVAKRNLLRLATREATQHLLDSRVHVNTKKTISVGGQERTVLVPIAYTAVSTDRHVPVDKDKDVDVSQDSSVDVDSPDEVTDD